MSSTDFSSYKEIMLVLAALLSMTAGIFAFIMGGCACVWAAGVFIDRAGKLARRSKS